MVFGSSPLQRSSQVESGLQLTEQEPVQVTVQVEASAQVTLPLAPTVTSQVDPPPQSMLQEAPHSPLHSLSWVQASVQLSPEHSLPARSHASPAGQLQLVPVHSGGGTSASSDDPPQATTRRKRREAAARGRRRDMEVPLSRRRATRAAPQASGFRPPLAVRAAHCAVTVQWVRRAPGAPAGRQTNDFRLPADARGSPQGTGDALLPDMARILVLFSTTHGHTREIAWTIERHLRRRGHVVDLVDAEQAEPNPGEYDLVVLGSRLERGRHAAAIRRYARRRQAELDLLPTAFFSVGSGGRDAAVAALSRATGWHPGRTVSFGGGAGRPRRRRPLLAGLMHRLLGAQLESGPPGRDRTDWTAVRAFADDLADAADRTAPASRVEHRGAPPEQPGALR